MQKTSFLGPKWPKLANFGKKRIFGENPAVSLFIIYGPLTSCQKSEKFIDWLSGKMIN